MSDPRASIVAALLTRAVQAALAFARVVSPGGEAMPPCWGDLADHFNAILATDEARIEVFEALRTVGDLGALVLFLDLNRTRPAVLQHVWSVAQALPATTQCALVSLDESASVASEVAAKLHPAARLLLADTAARARDHEMYAAHAASLRAQRTRLPQVTEPGSPTP
jgi:hypothetical protein